MKKQLQDRLNALKSEFENGQNQLAETENKAAQLRQTLLRISGAIQVLEEVLSESESAEPETEENLKAANS
jgi:predicted nuclease with TOPRIM domain